MAAIMGRTEVGVREFGRKVTIPSDPRAKLMYYLDCICTVLDLSDERNLSRLRDYQKYYLLSEEETDALIALTLLLSPDKLNNKVIFQDDVMCGNNSNTFFELSAVQNNLLLTDSILIGGQRRTVRKIMSYKRQWVLTNWYNPMTTFTDRLENLAEGAGGNRRRPQTRPRIGYRTSNNGYRTFPETSSESSSCCCCTII